MRSFYQFSIVILLLLLALPGRSQSLEATYEALPVTKTVHAEVNKEDSAGAPLIALKRKLCEQINRKTQARFYYVFISDDDRATLSGCHLRRVEAQACSFLLLVLYAFFDTYLLTTKPDFSLIDVLKVAEFSRQFGLQPIKANQKATPRNQRPRLSNCASFTTSVINSRFYMKSAQANRSEPKE